MSPGDDWWLCRCGYGPEVRCELHERMREARKVKPREECQCGCGELVVRPTAHFIRGHDATLRARLVAAALAGDQDAKAELDRRGWEMRLGSRRQRFLIEVAAGGARRRQAP
jgi:hypothetical protein